MVQQLDLLCPVKDGEDDGIAWNFKIVFGAQFY